METDRREDMVTAGGNILFPCMGNRFPCKQYMAGEFIEREVAETVPKKD